EKDGAAKSGNKGSERSRSKQSRDGHRHRRPQGQRKSNGAKPAASAAVSIPKDRRFDRADRSTAGGVAAEKPARERKAPKSVERDRESMAQEAESRFYSRRKSK